MKNNKITTCIIRCRPYSPHSLSWCPYWVSYPRYFVVYRRQKCIFFIVYRRQDGNDICPREGFASTKHLQKTANIAVWREKTRILCGGKTFRGYSWIYGLFFNEIVMYQRVMLHLFGFYLVEDMGSWGAKNEGLSLFLKFKWLPQGILWFCRWRQTPPQN